MVIVRNPETSLFSSMPESIIAAGITDFILEPALMPALIEDYIENDGEILSSGVDDEQHINTIITLIKQRSAFDFSNYKLSTISRGIIRRANYNNFTKLEDYVDFFRKTTEEAGILAKDFFISVTYFFWDKEAFDFIQKKYCPTYLKSWKQKKS